MSGNKYFYMATVKSATSVTQCLKASFTLSPVSTEELQDQRQSRNDNRSQIHKPDMNIVIAKSNVLQIMRITKHALETMFEIPFNDQIINLVKVPIANIMGERAGRDNATQSQDYIFVLTSDFKCVLLAYNTTQGVYSVSNGNISDQIGQKREPPYSVFLGPTGKYLCLMMYENVIKVIPIMKSQSNKVSLSNAFNVRIRHPELNQIIPLYDPDNQGNTFGVFYSEQIHRNVNQVLQQVPVLKFKKYELNLVDKDIVDTNSKDDISELENTNIYKVIPLDFGGYVAFDPDFVHVYRKNIKSKIISKKLRTQLVVTAICNIDQYNPQTKLTEEGSKLMRYLIATEQGELYMLGFFLEYLHLINAVGAQSSNATEANAFVIIEFLGSKLSSCSTLQYIDNGYLYYGSKLGDSMLIQLQTENQKDKDKPYIRIIETYPNLGPIQDMAFRRDYVEKGQQNELILLGGTYYNSHISVIKKGISVKKLVEIDSMPQLAATNGLFLLDNDKLLLKFNGVNQLIGIQVNRTGDECSVQDYEITEALIIDPTRLERIIALEQALVDGQAVYVFVTNLRIRVVSQDLQQVLREYNIGNDQEITNVSITQYKILASLQAGVLLYFDLTMQTDQLAPNNHMQFEQDISAIGISDKNGFAYVTLWDAPHYSLTVIWPATMTQVTKRSIACFVDQEQYKGFGQNIEIRESRTENTSDVEMMSIETASNSDVVMTSLNSHYPCQAVISLQVLSLGDQDFIICGLTNGKIVQLNLSIPLAQQIINEPQNFPPQLSLSFFDMQDVESHYNSNKHIDVPHVLWNIQVNTIGDQEINLKKMTNKDNEKVVLVCCDKPAIFFPTKEVLNMQYINEPHIKQGYFMHIGGKNSLFIYENKVGSIQLSEMDPLQNLQLHQSHFDLELTKVSMIPKDEFMVVLQEQPHFAYINKEDNKFNKVALLNKYTHKQYFSYDLEVGEVPVCIQHIDKKVTGTLNIASKQFGRFVMVGTGYIDLNEDVPTRGRLLIFEINSQQQKLELKFIQRLSGSIQAIATIKDDHKYLVLGINNEVKLYSFALHSGPHFKIEELQSKSIGAFIQDIKVIQNTIVVGDIMKAIMLYDFKESRAAASNRMLTESAHSSDSIWTNYVLPLSTSHFMMFDKEKNLFIYERILLPINDQEKFKLNLVGCIKVGEEVTRAVFGTLNIQSGSMSDRNTSDSKQRSYMNKTRSSKKNKDVIMTAEGGPASAEHPSGSFVDDDKIKTDKRYLQDMCKMAISETRKFNEGQYIMYGTQEGSLGTLIEITGKTYKFLQQLQNMMEQEGITDLGKISRKDHRKAKTDSQPKGIESFNIIDGDFVEMFLNLESKQSNAIVQHMIANNRDSAVQYMKEIKSLIELLKDSH